MVLGVGTAPAPAPPPELSKGGPTRLPREAAAKRRRLAPRAPAGCSLSCRNLVPTAGTGCEGVLGGAWRAAWELGGSVGGAYTSSRESRYPTSYGATGQGVTGLLRPWAKGAAPWEGQTPSCWQGWGCSCPLPGKCQPCRSLSPKTARHPISRETTAMEAPTKRTLLLLPHF